MQIGLVTPRTDELSVALFKRQVGPSLGLAYTVTYIEYKVYVLGGFTVGSNAVRVSLMVCRLFFLHPHITKSYDVIQQSHLDRYVLGICPSGQRLARPV